MKAGKKILSGLMLSLCTVSSALAGYSSFYNVELIRTASGGWLGFQNESSTVLGDAVCPNAIIVKWTIDPNSEYYKRVLVTLLTAKAMGAQVRWWHCGCSADGKEIIACDIDLK